MVRLLVAAAAVFLLALFLSGCLYTTQEQECDIIVENGWEKATCFHEVAVGMAARGEGANAVSECNKIRTLEAFWVQTEANNCFSDVAEITHNNTICENIQYTLTQEVMDDVGLSYKQECIRKANALLEPYSINICAGAFALLSPVALLAFLGFRKN